MELFRFRSCYQWPVSVGGLNEAKYVKIRSVFVTLPKASSLNEDVTLDLKDFGNMYVLWMIDSFSRFMVGKLKSNKRADTIMHAIMDS